MDENWSQTAISARRLTEAPRRERLTGLHTPEWPEQPGRFNSLDQDSQTQAMGASSAPNLTDGQ